jgi:bifunctional enzyme CysN/CysC
VECEVSTIHRIIDTTDLAARETKTSIARNEVAELTIRTKAPIAFDLYGDFEVTGRFVLVDQYDVSGGGIITEAVKDEHTVLREEARRRDIAWVKGDVGIEDRAKHFGHRAALVLITGRRHTGKSMLARSLEVRLVADGRHSYLLDAANLRRGLDADLSEEDTGEIVRRFGEVARLLMDTGLIVVSTTNAFAGADHQAIRTLVHPTPLITVHMSKSAEAPPPDTDLAFAGPKDFEAIADRVIEELKRRGVLAQAIGAKPQFHYSI